MVFAAKGNCDSCMALGSHYFTLKRFHDKWNSVGFIDKVLKAADPVMDLAHVIATNNGATEDTLKEITNTRHMVKTGRDVVAFFNILNGIILDVINRTKVVVALVMNFCANTPEENIDLKEKRKKDGRELPLEYNQVAVGRDEQMAAAVENFGKVVASITYIGAFGVCRPIANVEKHITKNVHPTASNIAKAFPTVMMVNHIGGIIGNSGGLVYQHLAFHRRKEEPFRDQQAFDDVQLEYHRKMFENSLGMVEKTLEFANDIFLHAKVTLPAWARLPINLTIGFSCLANSWLKDFS